MHKKFSLLPYCRLRLPSTVRNHYGTRERLRCRVRCANRPLGAGFKSETVLCRSVAEFTWQHAVLCRTERAGVLRVPSRSACLQEALSGTGQIRQDRGNCFGSRTDAGPRRRKRATGSGASAPARIARTPRSARHIGRRVEDGWIRPIVETFAAVAGACLISERDPCAAEVYRQGHRRDARIQGLIALASTSRQAPGASGVSSRDTLRRS